jgi:large subunit ribosomal protein L20
MARPAPGVATRKRRKRWLNDAEGYRASRSTLYKNAKQTVIKAGVYAYRDRRTKKREFRALWITRIAAGCAMRGISYSRFMNGLRMAAIGLNRKMLSEVAIHDPAAFDKLVDLARKHVAAAA